MAFFANCPRDVRLPAMLCERRATATCLVLVLFFTTAAAKCRSDFVKIHGHVRCTVRPGDKVLVSLILTDRQPEGSAPETALDIQERAFSGEVIFNTNGSNRYEKCNVRPKAVLVRLIAANGSEQNRTLLKISDAFNYDAEHGEYVPVADNNLSGWCDPSVGETP